MITPSDEFRTAGPIKQDLTSHVGPITLSVSPPNPLEGYYKTNRQHRTRRIQNLATFFFLMRILFS